MVIAVLLTVTIFSCTPIQHATEDDEYYTETRRQAPNRIYVNDPYLGYVLLERDPWSGRYYQVGPNGFNSLYNPGYYRNGFYGNDGYYRNNRISDNGYYRRNNAPRNNQPQQSDDKRQRQREEARRKILGGN
jgi:hypothetical protein